MPLKNKDIEENKYVAAMSYLWILCLVPLFLKRGSKFAQFHAKQGVLLFVIEIAGTIIFPIPLIGWALWFLVVGVSVVAVLKALSGEYWKMPIIGQYAKKLNL